MTINYAAQLSKVTQSEPLDETQVKNNAGGYVHTVDKWARLRRFLILGSEGGTYYVGASKLTRDNAKVVQECLTLDPSRTTREIVLVSDNGLAPKNSPAIFALSLAASHDEHRIRAGALAVLSKVCRIPTHLFEFVEYINELRGWGAALRKAISRWYNKLDPANLEYFLMKYKQRNGWSNKDVLRLAHPIPKTPAHDALFGYATGKKPATTTRIIASEVLHRLQNDGTLTPREASNTIRKYDLPREVLPTELLKYPEVWEAMLEKMPLTAMLRNLGVMSSTGLLTPMSPPVKMVKHKLLNLKALQGARIHPVQLMIAAKIYGEGRGFRGSLTWKVDGSIERALDEAFHMLTTAQEKVDGTVIIALDVSGSMGSPILGLPLSAREGAAGMALALMNQFEEYHVIAYTSGDIGLHNYYQTSNVTPLEFMHTSRLKHVIGLTNALPFGPTDCALPFIYAELNGIKADAIVSITDNETWAGSVQPMVALKSYRKKISPGCKAVTMAMTATEYDVLDLRDQNCLSVVGLDASAPKVVADFVAGRFDV